MNYFLIANNKNIKEFTINKISYNINNDILVLFNFLIPFHRFDKIKYYPNKICVSRKRPTQYRLYSTLFPEIKEYYCNMGIIKQYQDMFKEIYFLPCSYNIIENPQSYIDNIALFQFDTNKIKCIDYNLIDMANKLQYFKTGIQAEVSTGIIVYEHIKTIKKSHDQIILVCFNSELTSHHDQEWETNYFFNEISLGKCLTIDCYNLPDSYSQTK